MTVPSGVTPPLPTHWSPEQALAVFECLQVMREALWAAYGPQVQQAWREQLRSEHDLPQLDPDAPFRTPPRLHRYS